MTSEFTKIDNPETLLHILELRLPMSCFMINQVKCYDTFGHDDLTFYMHGSGKDEVDTWILTKYFRKDYNEFISISAPSKTTKDNEENIKSILRFSGFLDWTRPLVFTALETNVTNMVTSLHADAVEQEQSISTFPCCLYYMTPEEALKLDTSYPSETVRVGPLETSSTNFITDNWAYHNSKSYPVIRKCIERLISGGVYVKENEETEEKLVCGAITLALGLLSMLHTDPDHRRKGYASLCERYILKEYARHGFQPCLVSELDNAQAVVFHKSVGLRNIGRVLYVVNFAVNHVDHAGADAKSAK